VHATFIRFVEAKEVMFSSPRQVQSRRNGDVFSRALLQSRGTMNQTWEGDLVVCGDQYVDTMIALEVFLLIVKGKSAQLRPSPQGLVSYDSAAQNCAML
jgi:hypothetical protein